MNKRTIGAIVITVLIVIVLLLLFAPTMVSEDADIMPDDTTGPKEEGMAATGTPETPVASPEARPAPGEVKVQ